MESKKIRIALTHGDVNGIGCEVILKAFTESFMYDLCTPILYGSAKALAYHKKTLKIEVNYHQIESPHQAVEGRLNVIDCIGGELHTDFGRPSAESGKAAVTALECAVADYREGFVEAIVTAPIHKESAQSEAFRFAGQTEYFADRLGNGQEPLMILMNEVMRIALVTTHLPISAVSAAITGQSIERKIAIFNAALHHDFCISQPRIAVLALNPHSGEGGVIGSEEETTIRPAISNMAEQGILCYGPYAADGFFGAGLYKHFDGVLAMYHDQGLAPFKALSMGDGVNYTAGLPVVRTSPDHGTAYDIAGQGIANENSLRQAIYAAIDICRNRKFMTEAKANPLKKLYKERREDSRNA